MKSIKLGLLLSLAAAEPPFTSYTPSSAEAEWHTSPKKGRICETTVKPGQIQAAKNWLSYSIPSFDLNHSLPLPLNEIQRQALSVMRYGNVLEPIEPLHGIGRHPFANVGCFRPRSHHHTARNTEEGLNEIHKINHNVTIAHLFDLTYLILHNNCGARDEPKGKKLLFDLGCSVGFDGFQKNGGLPEKTPRKGSGKGGSLPLFMKLYWDRCIEFDQIYGWEVTEHPPTQWWSTLPPDIRAKVHYYNIPVEEEKAELKDGRLIENPSSFLALLRATAKPEDFVVVKLDIDTPLLEQTIVKALIEDDSLAALVDELFFENHYYFDGIGFGWGDLWTGDVDSALAAMRKLRERGIRAHFWV
jgi:hypothetical protein